MLFLQALTKNWTLGQSVLDMVPHQISTKLPTNSTIAHCLDYVADHLSYCSVVWLASGSLFQRFGVSFVREKHGDPQSIHVTKIHHDDIIGHPSRLRRRPWIVWSAASRASRGPNLTLPMAVAFMVGREKCEVGWGLCLRSFDGGHPCHQKIRNNME